MASFSFSPFFFFFLNLPDTLTHTAHGTSGNSRAPSAVATARGEDLLTEKHKASEKPMKNPSSVARHWGVFSGSDAAWGHWLCGKGMGAPTHPKNGNEAWHTGGETPPHRAGAGSHGARVPLCSSH